MTQPTTEFRHSWFEHNDDNRQTLEYFSKLTDKKLRLLTQVQHALREVGIPFQETASALPFQCRKATCTLIELNAHIQTICLLFQEPDSLPIVVVALRYQLLDELYFFEEQTSELVDLINNYYEVCTTSSLKVIRQGQAIGELFQTLTLAIADIPQKVRFLMHEAMFRERGSTITT